MNNCIYVISAFFCIIDVVVYVIRILRSNKNINVIRDKNITAYYTNKTKVYVLCDNKEIYSFVKSGKTNLEFLQFLKNNFKEEFIVREEEITSLIYRLIGYFIILNCSLYESIIGVIIGIILIIFGINESIKKLYINDNKFIYKKFLFRKLINFSDISKIKYEKYIGIGKYKNMVPTTYNIKIYRDDRCYIKVKNISEDTLKLLKDISKDNKIKVDRNK